MREDDLRSFGRVLVENRTECWRMCKERSEKNNWCYHTKNPTVVGPWMLNVIPSQPSTLQWENIPSFIHIILTIESFTHQFIHSVKHGAVHVHQTSHRAPGSLLSTTGSNTLLRTSLYIKLTAHNVGCDSVLVWLVSCSTVNLHSMMTG